MEQPMTLEDIQKTIHIARDSVWVVTDTLQKLENGETTSWELKRNIESNVGHLKIITTSKEILDSKEDISDLLAVIEAGENKLAEDIWPKE